MGKTAFRNRQTFNPPAAGDHRPSRWTTGPDAGGPSQKSRNSQQDICSVKPKSVLSRLLGLERLGTLNDRFGLKGLANLPNRQPQIRNQPSHRTSSLARWKSRPRAWVRLPCALNVASAPCNTGFHHAFSTASSVRNRQTLGSSLFLFLASPKFTIASAKSKHAWLLRSAQINFLLPTFLLFFWAFQKKRRKVNINQTTKPDSPSNTSRTTPISSSPNPLAWRNPQYRGPHRPPSPSPPDGPTDAKP